MAAAAKLGMAQDLDQRLTGTRAAMLAGVLDDHKARLIVRATRVLITSSAAVVEAQVLPRAATWSYKRLKSELARLVIAADPVCASERHERARARRVVSKRRSEDGMGILTADLTADGLTTVWNALDAHARQSLAYAGRAQGDDRSVGQRRADGLVDLCAGYLDGVLAGDLEYRAPRTSTGWTTYRAHQPDDSSDPSDGCASGKSGSTSDTPGSKPTPEQHHQPDQPRLDRRRPWRRGCWTRPR
ncbi:MAG: 13E12 repeat family protein [Actinomycetota bacterium]|nr:13E12 repeat family protein [Actinomycetota bacterium]